MVNNKFPYYGKNFNDIALHFMYFFSKIMIIVLLLEGKNNKSSYTLH